jgi:hypothetical protein
MFHSSSLQAISMKTRDPGPPRGRWSLASPLLVLMAATRCDASAYVGVRGGAGAETPPSVASHAADSAGALLAENGLLSAGGRGAHARRALGTSSIDTMVVDKLISHNPTNSSRFGLGVATDGVTTVIGEDGDSMNTGKNTHTPILHIHISICYFICVYGHCLYLAAILIELVVFLCHFHCVQELLTSSPALVSTRRGARSRS